MIHITGKTDSAELIRRQYEAAGIRACVKAFEERMDLAWSAADAVMGRSGAASIAELIKFEVPAYSFLFLKLPMIIRQKMLSLSKMKLEERSPVLNRL